MKKTPDSRTGDVIAIIPARGGSKGIPRKNIVDLGGKPLLAYSIETALAARRIDRVIVSTDDENIAAVAREWGAEVPFLRPKELAGDRAEINSAITHLLAEMKKREEWVRAYVELYPTHPFRKLSTVNKLVAKGLEGVVTVKTVRKISPRPGSLGTIDDAGMMQPLDLMDSSGSIVETMFRPYGLFVMRSLRPQQCHKNMYVHLVADPIELIDIDTPADLERARHILAQELFDFSA